MASKFKFDKISEAVDKAINDSIGIAGRDAKRFFERNFRMEGFTDENFKRWKARKGQIRGAVGAGLRSGHKNTKPTLTDTGKLKRSIRLTISHFKSILNSGLPYSAVHNEGLRAGRGAGFQMPQRKFMGNSSLLEKRILAKMTAKINTAIKNA